jgi:dCTP deaminase
MLTGNEIRKQVALKRIYIDDFCEKKLNPNSYNLSLHNTLMVYSSHLLDAKGRNPMQSIKIPTTGYVLKPNELYLGRTMERTATNHFIPVLNGRSSIGRLGIAIHVTAGFGDIGFNNYWTLEIVCVKKVTIYPFMQICQICYYSPEGIVDNLYQGKYQNTNQINGSHLYKEYENVK